MSKQRHLYVLVCVDAYSRYIVAVPLRNKQAKTVATKFYNHVIAVFGSVQLLHSDRGGEICSNNMTELTTLYGIQQTKSSGFHRHSSGLAESDVKCIVAALNTLCAKNPTTWDSYLPSLLWALNSSPVSFTGNLPYLLLFGRLPYSSHDSITQPTDDKINIHSEFLQDILQDHILIAEDVQSN